MSTGVILTLVSCISNARIGCWAGVSGQYPRPSKWWPVADHCPALALSKFSRDRPFVSETATKTKSAPAKQIPA